MAHSLSSLRRAQVESVLRNAQAFQRLTSHRLAELSDSSSYYSTMGFLPAEERLRYIKLARLIVRCLRRIGIEPVEFLNDEPAGSLFVDLPQPEILPDLTIPEVPHTAPSEFSSLPVLDVAALDELFPTPALLEI